MFGKRFVWISTFFGLGILSTGCMTRAPTSYELDRRAGLLPPNESGIENDLPQIKTNSNSEKKTQMPERLPPVVEKVWITPQILPDGSKLDGTWMWIEVDHGRWRDDSNGVAQ